MSFCAIEAICGKSQPCSNGGACNSTSGLCNCAPFFFGELCEISEGKNFSTNQITIIYAFREFLEPVFLILLQTGIRPLLYKLKFYKTTAQGIHACDDDKTKHLTISTTTGSD